MNSPAQHSKHSRTTITIRMWLRSYDPHPMNSTISFFGRTVIKTLSSFELAEYKRDLNHPGDTVTLCAARFAEFLAYFRGVNSKRRFPNLNETKGNSTCQLIYILT